MPYLNNTYKYNNAGRKLMSEKEVHSHHLLYLRSMVWTDEPSFFFDKQQKVASY